MALNSKDPVTDSLAHEVASRVGDLQRYIDHARQRATLDERDSETILGYDQHGLPS